MRVEESGGQRELCVSRRELGTERALCVRVEESWGQRELCVSRREESWRQRELCVRVEESGGQRELCVSRREWGTERALCEQKRVGDRESFV